MADVTWILHQIKRTRFSAHTPLTRRDIGRIHVPCPGVQRELQFDRWLKVNAVVASIFSAALVTMAFLGTPFSGSVDT